MTIPLQTTSQKSIQPFVLDFINQQCADEFEPFYIYDSEVIRKNCRVLLDIPWENKRIHFASMANVHPEFLRIVREEGVKIFVNSLGHMELARAAGFRADDIIFTASALTKKTMQLLEMEGVQCNVDSPAQLACRQELFPGKPVGIRCNIGDKVVPYSTYAGYFIGKQSRLGFTLEEIDAIENKELINGLHLYVGTDIFDLDYFFSCYRVLADLSLKFPRLEYLNLGGGFGVSENGETTFNWSEYYSGIKLLMEEISLKKGKSIRLILEPGRIIGGEAGYFVACVSDVKFRPGFRLVGLNASTVQFSRPLLYPENANHPVTVIRNREIVSDAGITPTTIYGCSTYSRDLFTRNKLLPEIKTGDVIVFGVAGSYSASSFSTFLGFPKPEEHFI
jgi:diaminopimelate decarboxylase